MNEFIKIQMARAKARREELKKWQKEYEARDIAPVCLLGVDVNGKFYVNFPDFISKKELAQILTNVGLQMANDAVSKVD